MNNRWSRAVFRAAAVCVASVGVALCQSATAQTYPTKPIRLIIPFPTGGPNDIVARAVADELSKGLGQSVFADNRPGASGNIAAEAAARSAPDGYMLFWAQGATHGVNPWIYGSTVKFDPINDFAAVGLVGQTPIVMVTAPGSGLKSVHDVLKRAKAQPQRLTFGSGGHGTTPHMAGELLQSSAGIKLMHIPYKGSQPALTDVMAGRLDIAFDGVASAVGYIKSGQLVALGVSTRERLALLPDVAPIADAVPDFDIASWSGIAAPAGTPAAIVKRLNDELNHALNSPALLERFRQLSVMPLGGSPTDMEKHVRTELHKWKKIVADNGIQVQ